MTDQVPTKYVHYKGKGYILFSLERGLFSPWDHGIHPEDSDSSNGMGFVAHFVVQDERLYLDYLTVSHTPPARKRPSQQPDPLFELIGGEYTLPPLNGVQPTNAGMGYWHYQNIHLALDYTGTMTLGDEPPQGYPNPFALPGAPAHLQTKQPDHLELVFEQGRLVSAKSIPAPIPDDVMGFDGPTGQPADVTPLEDWLTSDFDQLFGGNNANDDSDGTPDKET